MKTFFLLLIAAIIGSAVMYLLTRPADIGDNEMGYLIQEFCKQEVGDAKVSGGEVVASFTHKLRRTQILILRCATVEEVQESCITPSTKLL